MGEKQMDECQSPIWKKKRESNRAEEKNAGFGIKLFNTSAEKNNTDKIVEPDQDDKNLPSVLPVTKAKSKEFEKVVPKEDADDDKIEL